jgi:adenine C2-methylase RlmN of 23S rRNA A2503 and tRNA A37
MQRETQMLVSKLDRSVNFVLPNSQETRYVRRNDDYFIVYLSSHNGCNKTCRFCHLTQTGQTEFVEASYEDMISQARLILNHYRRQVELGLEPKANKVHFNWMARGEPLSSKTLTNNWDNLSRDLAHLAYDRGINEVKFKISTIMPLDYEGSLVKDFGNDKYHPEHRPTFYYSLYSVEDTFRKKWLPKAMSVNEALTKLTLWQYVTEREVVLHWAFIRGENDTTSNVHQILERLEQFQIKTRFNLVRYNPFDNLKSEESDPQRLAELFKIMESGMGLKGSKIISRVGQDIAASCGTFINLKE